MQLRIWLWRTRHIIAALCVGFVIVAAIRALAPNLDTVQVWVASRDLAPGTLVTIHDVTPVAIARQVSVPAAAASPLGAHLAVGVPAGAAILTPMLQEGTAKIGIPPGHMAVSVPVAQDNSPPLEAGTLVTIFGPQAGCDTACPLVVLAASVPILASQDPAKSVLSSTNQDFIRVSLSPSQARDVFAALSTQGALHIGVQG